MILKKYSPRLAIYQRSMMVNVLLKPFGAVILLVGLLNIYFAAGEKSLPFWVIGIITGIGWIAVFGGYRVRLDLENKFIELKASSLMPIFKRRYCLAGARGFRVVNCGAGTLPYSVVFVTRAGEQIAISNMKYRGNAIVAARDFAEFTGLPVVEKID